MRTGERHRGRTCTRHGRGMYLVALGLTLLATAACGARTYVPRISTVATATPTVTATAVPVPPLAFRPVALPQGYDPHSGSIAVSPVDGKDAWACATAGNGLFKIWATTDEGSTWHAAGLLHPATPQEPTYSCRIVADQRDTQAAVFVVTWGSGEACTLASMSFYTRDSGQHWQQLSGWTDMYSVATDGASVYALLTIITPFNGQTQSALLENISPPRLSAPGPCPPQQTQGRSGFMVSSDGLYTWRELHPGGSTTQDPVSNFWRSPTSGELFAATYSGVLWRSLDGGASWTQIHLSTPGIQISLERWLASRKAWMFCGTQGEPPITTCSMDGGNTWKPTPILTVTVHSRCDAWCRQKGGLDSQPSICPTFGLEANGSLLAACPSDGTTTGPVAYRLAPGGAAWTILGSMPAQSCSFSANDILWCLDNGEWESLALPA